MHFSLGKAYEDNKKFDLSFKHYKKGNDFMKSKSMFNAQDYIEEELNAWKAFGVEGHFKGKHPWMPYHEFLTENMATMMGAKPLLNAFFTLSTSDGTL